MHLTHLSIASPGNPPEDHGGFDDFALPDGGELDDEVGYGVGHTDRRQSAL